MSLEICNFVVGKEFAGWKILHHRQGNIITFFLAGWTAGLGSTSQDKDAILHACSDVVLIKIDDGSRS